LSDIRDDETNHHADAPPAADIPMDPIASSDGATIEEMPVVEPEALPQAEVQAETDSVLGAPEPATELEASMTSAGADLTMAPAADTGDTGAPAADTDAAAPATDADTDAAAPEPLDYDA